MIALSGTWELRRRWAWHSVVRGEVPPAGDEGEAWESDDGLAAAWLRVRRRPRRRGLWLAGFGEPAAMAKLVAELVRERPRVAGITVPRGTVEVLPRELRPPAAVDWDWFFLQCEPPPQRGEDRVRWLDADAAPSITALLEASSPRASAMPGDREVQRWCGVDDGDRLVAVAAATELVGELSDGARIGVPHLASIAVAADRRRDGLGAAVTAWLTRRLLSEGFDEVTLGMYADNHPARALYLRLGFDDRYRYTSGRLPPPG